jgi:hypothetical protein
MQSCSEEVEPPLAGVCINYNFLSEAHRDASPIIVTAPVAAFQGTQRLRFKAGVSEQICEPHDAK